MSDFIDLPDRTRITLDATYRDRIDAVPFDQHHCTIANAIVRAGRSVGILSLARSGVSRTMVRLTLDPKRHRWAKPDQVYRGRLDNDTAAMAVELDSWLERPAQVHEAFTRTLRREARKQPNGLDAVWGKITIVAPLPSQRKGYRSGTGGGTAWRPRPAVSGMPPRRYNGWARATRP